MLAQDDTQYYPIEDRIDVQYDEYHHTYGSSGGGGAVVSAPVTVPTPLTPDVSGSNWADDLLLMSDTPTVDFLDLSSVDYGLINDALVSSIENNTDPTTLPPNTMLSTDGNVPNESGNYIPAIVQRDDTVPTATGGTTGGTTIPSIGDGAIETPTQQANNTAAEIKTAEPITGKSNKILIILGVLLVLFIVYKLFKRQS